MKTKIVAAAAVILLVLFSGCRPHRDASNLTDMNDKLKTIYFAGGCFWGTEHFFRQIKGVVQTRVGYANSSVPSPSYHDVCEGLTGAVEAVRVKYDPSEVSLEFLVKAFFMTIDPTTINRQGNDVGPQYRTDRKSVV